MVACSGLIQGGEENGPAEAQRRLRGIWEDLGASKPLDATREALLLNLPFTWEVSPYVWDLGLRDEMVSRLPNSRPSWRRCLRSGPFEPTVPGATDILNGVSVAITQEPQGRS